MKAEVEVEDLFGLASEDDTQQAGCMKDGVRSGQCSARHGKKTMTFFKKTKTLKDIVKAGVDAQRKLDIEELFGLCSEEDEKQPAVSPATRAELEAQCRKEIEELCGACSEDDKQPAVPLATPPEYQMQPAVPPATQPVYYGENRCYFVGTPCEKRKRGPRRPMSKSAASATAPLQEFAQQQGMPPMPCQHPPPRHSPCPQVPQQRPLCTPPFPPVPLQSPPPTPPPHFHMPPTPNHQHLAALPLPPPPPPLVLVPSSQPLAPGGDGSWFENMGQDAAPVLCKFKVGEFQWSESCKQCIPS